MVHLRDLREAWGRTLRETGTLAGLSWSELARVERGERRLSSEARLRIIRAFDLTDDDVREIAELTPFPVEVGV